MMISAKQENQTRTITRGQMKSVETGLRLGQFPLPTGQIDLGFKALWDWITGKSGEYRRQATQFAEDAVKLFYGLEPDCRMPPPNLPIIPNNPNPTFCVGSVAGMIERCRLGEASSLLSQTKNLFQQRMNSATDPAAPYIKNWYNQYGINDFSSLELKINSARASCGLVGSVPKLCMTGYEWDFSRSQCVPIGSTGGGIYNPEPFGLSTTTLLLIAGGVALLFLARR